MQIHVTKESDFDVLPIGYLKDIAKGGYRGRYLLNPILCLLAQSMLRRQMMAFCDCLVLYWFLHIFNRRHQIV